MTGNGQWRPIEPLDPLVEEELRGDLAVLDALHRSWAEWGASLAEADRAALRCRTLRKHAIETGIIEQLYRIDKDVTHTLVAAGFDDQDALERRGVKLPPEVMTMLKFQLEALEMVDDYVRAGYPLTTSFVKELHALMTWTQTHYEATDTLGRPLRARLDRGRFKTLPNNVIRG